MALDERNNAEFVDVRRLYPYLGAQSISTKEFVSRINALGRHFNHSQDRMENRDPLYRSMKNCIFTVHFMRMSEERREKLRAWVRANADKKEMRERSDPEGLDMTMACASNFIGFIDTDRFHAMYKYVRFLLAEDLASRNAPAVISDQ